MKLFKTIILLFGIMAMFFSTGCLIEDVSQPSAIKTGETFTCTITVSDYLAETNIPHKGVLMVLAPSDWTFVSGTYQTAKGSGKMVLDPSVNYVYGNIDTLIAIPAGMKWIHLLSDTGYLYSANFIMETTVNFKVGSKTGTFPIGYACTKNTGSMLALNPKDVDNDAAWTDTSMNHSVKITASSAVTEKNIGSPDGYSLSQNYPNPFNPSTRISYSVSKPGELSIIVYDASGKEVEKLVDGYRAAGMYEVTFDAANIASGIYYYKIAASGFNETKKMILLK